MAILSLHRAPPPPPQWPGPSGFIGPSDPPPDPDRVVMVGAQEDSVLEVSQPGADAIAAALRRPATLDAVYGDWLGSGPRITRQAIFPGSFRTIVEYPWVMGAALGAADRAAFADILAAMVTDSLRRVSLDFTPATVQPYAASANGPLSFWQGGAAQGTASRAAAPTGLDRTLGSTVDNPAGPTPPRPPWGTILAVVGLGVVATVAAVELGPVLRRRAPA